MNKSIKQYISFDWTIEKLYFLLNLHLLFIGSMLLYFPFSINIVLDKEQDAKGCESRQKLGEGLSNECSIIIISQIAKEELEENWINATS